MTGVPGDASTALPTRRGAGSAASAGERARRPAAFPDIQGGSVASVRGVEERTSGVSTDTNDQILNGARVLVVEDEAAISMLLEDMLLDFGCDVVGPAARLSTALEMAEKESFAVAILDVNLAGEPIYPVAEAVVRRGLPLVFSTGYGGAGIREPFRDRPVVQKPFSQQDLKRTLVAAIQGATA
jgi:CheY-like chemotaxis protein